MNKRLLIVLAFLTAVSFGCNLLSQTTGSSETRGGTPTANSANVSLTPTPGAQAEGISAQATSAGSGAVSVSITWESIPGAAEYLLEINLGGEFIPMAVLPTAQTAYQDENAPPSTRLTYRLSSVVKGEKQASKEVSVDTPAEAASPLHVGIEPDRAPAALSLDPDNLDLSSLDPDNLDPAMFMPQPVEAEAILGPQGGEITVTGTNGVIYTLVVAPGALRSETPIKLKPIASVTDLPLSGGALATVLIEPDSLVFDIPAQLKITPPAGFAAAPLQLAYAFDEQGQEFHLYPFSPAAGQSRLGREVAGLGFIPRLVPPLSDIAPVQSGGAYGVGNGNVNDVKKIIQNPASKQRHRTEQRLATNQLDELTPLSPIPDDLTPLPSKKSLEFGKTGEAIRQKAAQADNWAKLIEAVDDFSVYINAGADKFNPALNDKILDLLATKAQALLQKNKGECLTYDDFVAQEMVERLSNPKDGVSKALADRFKAKYGQKLLNDLTYGKKNCTFELSLDSKLTFSAEGSMLTTLAKAPIIKLFLVYSKGEVFLWGAGNMDLQDKVSGVCNFPLKHYDNLLFVVEKLVPVFDNGVLVDFNLYRYSVSGWKKAVSIRGGAGEKCPVFVNLQGGGDYWTGLFTLSRMDESIVDWQLQNNLAQGSSLTADWVSLRPSFAPLGTSGGSMTEDTKFKLKVTKTKP